MKTVPLDPYQVETGYTVARHAHGCALREHLDQDLGGRQDEVQPDPHLLQLHHLLLAGTSSSPLELCTDSVGGRSLEERAQDR